VRFTPFIDNRTLSNGSPNGDPFRKRRCVHDDEREGKKIRVKWKG